MNEQKPLFDNLPAKQVHDFEHTEARHLFEKQMGELDLAWSTWFAQLMAEGFTWREAAVCAWLIPDKPDRVPKTQKELAKLLGCGVDTVRNHRRKPKVQLRATTLKIQRFALHADDIINASIETAKMPGGRQTAERKMILEELGILSKSKDLRLSVTTPSNRSPSTVSDAELAAMAGIDMGDVIDGEVIEETQAGRGGRNES